MGNFAGVAKMLPGIGGQLDNSKIREVEARLKRSKAMIQSMTKKERENPELFIGDKTARSRILRITRGSGNSFENGVAFISEFQKMRTMMSRMQKQMGGAGGPEGMDPALAGGMGGEVPQMGNRKMRRASKKMKKGGRGGGMGFGS